MKYLITKKKYRCCDCECIIPSGTETLREFIDAGSHVSRKYRCPNCAKTAINKLLRCAIQAKRDWQSIPHDH